MARVAFREVSKEFPGGTLALDRLTLEVGDGEFMILVGPSGCGKTTALRLVAGLERPTTGSIVIGDSVVDGLPPRDRDVAMVFQSYALYPHMSVYKNLAFGLRERRVPKAETDRRVREMAALLGLESLLRRRPGQLSGGQRQRVAMGRALVREPRAFLLDEPLSNLDAKLRVQMRAELKQLHRRIGVTTIYVTHDQIEAMTLGDRVAVMSDGVLQQVGSPQEVYEHPRNLFVAHFIGSPPMNMLRGSCREGRVSAGDLMLDMPAVPDGDLVLGLRPESFLPGPPAAAPSLDLAVEVVEPLGSEILAHGTIAGELASVERVGDDDVLPALPGSRAVITARLPARWRVRVGERLRLGVDPAEVHVFDAQTGAAIARAGAG